MAVAPFLAGVLPSGPAPALINLRTGQVVASAVEIAVTGESRRRGLLGRNSLDPSRALVIAPCSAIHTFFMRFAIDVVFIDRRGGVLKIVRDVQPWQMAGSLGAHAVIELASGSVGPDTVSVGDQLQIRNAGTQPDHPPEDVETAG